MIYTISYGRFINHASLEAALKAENNPPSQQVWVKGFQRHLGAVPKIPLGGVSAQFTRNGRPVVVQKRRSICTISESKRYSFNGVLYLLNDELYARLIVVEAAIGFSPIPVSWGHITSFPERRLLHRNHKAVSFSGSPENTVTHLEPDSRYIDTLIASATELGDQFFNAFIETTYFPNRNETLKQRYGKFIQE